MDTLPPHAPRCFGCGTDNPCGLRLQAHREGDRIKARVTFGAHHSGAPAFAHGGAVATALDDCLGFLLYVAETPAVTAKLETNYRRPVLIEEPYDLEAWITERNGRKIWAAIEMRSADGELAADGTGLFITVSIEHFTKDLPEDWRDRAADRGIELPW